MKLRTEPLACKNLQEIRDALDGIDREVIELLKERQAYVQEIVKFKGRDEEDIVASERKELVLKQRKAWAEESGLDSDMIEEIFSLLIKKNIQIQFEIQKSSNK